MIYRQLTEAMMEDISSRILFEDNHLLVFDKRAGEIVQGDKTGDEPLSETLKAFIAARDGKPGRVFLGVPHRLDRPVSGITVFAKTSKALERMGEMFRSGEVHKTYTAVVCAPPPKDEDLLEDWIWRNEKINKSFVGKREGSKLARLRYRLVGPTRNYWILEVELFTGRHHQIRCQLSHIGCPIKGDLKYGAPRSNPDGSICLAATSIRFIHPVTKVGTEICAKPSSAWPV